MLLQRSGRSIIVYNVLSIPFQTNIFVASDPFAKLTFAQTIPSRIQKTADVVITIGVSSELSNVLWDITAHF